MLDKAEKFTAAEVAEVYEAKHAYNMRRDYVEQNKHMFEPQKDG